MIMNGKFLREFLRKEGVSARELAQRLGCSTQNIYALYLRDTISTATLTDIAEAIGKPLAALFQSEENETENLKRQLEEKDREIARLNARIDKLIQIIDKMG